MGLYTKSEIGLSVGVIALAMLGTAYLGNAFGQENQKTQEAVQCDIIYNNADSSLTLIQPSYTDSIPQLLIYSLFDGHIQTLPDSKTEYPLQALYVTKENGCILIGEIVFDAEGNREFMPSTAVKTALENHYLYQDSNLSDSEIFSLSKIVFDSITLAINSLSDDAHFVMGSPNHKPTVYKADIQTILLAHIISRKPIEIYSNYVEALIASKCYPYTDGPNMCGPSI